MTDIGLGNTLLDNNESLNLQMVIRNKKLFRHSPNNNGFCSSVEEELRNILQVSYCRLITNGTAALQSAIMALRPEPGDIVIVPAISFIATANACLAVGLIPVTIDVDQSGHLDPAVLATYLYSNPKPFAVIAVHLDGGGCEIEQILKICDQFKIPLIEDVARAFGIKRNGKYLGTFGAFGCYSFQANKLLATGEGGALVANDKALFTDAISYSDHGASRNADGYPDWSSCHGFGINNKATELIGAVLASQLTKLDYIQFQLREHYDRITKLMPVGAFYQRDDKNVPTTVWIDSLEVQQALLAAGIALTSWSSLYIPGHCIIKDKKSLYRNNFPWNLAKQSLTTNCKIAENICTTRKSLLLPVKTEAFDKLRSSISLALLKMKN